MHTHVPSQIWDASQPQTMPSPYGAQGQLSIMELHLQQLPWAQRVMGVQDTGSLPSPGLPIPTFTSPGFLSPPDRGSWTLVTSRGLGSSLASESTRQHALLSLTRRIDQYPHGYLGIPGGSNEQAQASLEAEP